MTAILISMAIVAAEPQVHPLAKDQGLALYHLGKKDEAMKLWESTIKACSQDPWIYRADWAYTTLKQDGARGFFSTSGPKDSLLGRIGYMGRANPDLKTRSKRVEPSTKEK